MKLKNMFKRDSKTVSNREHDDIPDLKMVDVYDLDPIETEQTILSTVKECTDRVRQKLMLNDCDDVVTIYVSGKVGVIRFTNNKESYIRLNGTWEEIDL